MERLIEYLIAIPLVAYPILLAVGTWRGNVRFHKCTVDARHDQRIRAAYPEAGVRRRPEAPTADRSLVDHDEHV